jgi:hypothetical protein
MASSLPLSASQSRAVQSCDAVSTRRPAVWTKDRALNRVGAALESGQDPSRCHFSQSRAVLSSEAVSTHRPSGLKTALYTQPVWPSKVVRSLPLSASQSRAVLSSEAVSTRPAVRAKDRAINVIGMALESGQELAALSLPEPRLVLRGDKHPLAVRAKDRAINVVTFESGQELAALSLPEPRLVLRGGEHPPAVRAKDRAINTAGVAFESGQELAALSLGFNGRRGADRRTGNRHCDRRGWLRGRLHRHLWCRRSLFFNGRSGDYRWTWSHGCDRRVLRRWRLGRSYNEVNESTDRQDRRDRQKSDYLLRGPLASSSAR